VVVFCLHGNVPFELAGCEMLDVVLLIFLLCTFGGEPADCVWFQ